MFPLPRCFFLGLLLIAPAAMAENLLLNPEFRFTPFEVLRSAAAADGRRSGSVPFWEADRYGSIEVQRGAQAFRPRFPVEGVVEIRPGGTLTQWVLLSEAGIDPETTFSFAIEGHQPAGGLEVTIHAMAVDHEEGEWSPKAFGQSDGRAFPKAARGDLTPVQVAQAGAGAGETVRLENLRLPTEPGREYTALEVRLRNGGSQPLWVYAPRLVAGAKAPAGPEAGRALPELYRSLPRTISKLHAGEPLHFIVMGSSIDRASANPPLYRYDEDPASPTFKQPISKADRLFDGAAVGAPELTPYFGWWAHYYSYAGRLKRDLMTRFNYPADRLLLNFMAADGSSIGESHSALSAWSTLAHPPRPELNGHASGSDSSGRSAWQALYPALFERPGGPRPDLVIFGSGANEKVDGPDEVAAFEGAIRWFQHHYPGTEFVVAMWNWREQYTPNAAMMRQLALRYGLPVVEVGRELSLLTRHVEPARLTPADGHPQAAAHELWGRLLGRAFQATDPMGAGLPQAQLPERLSTYTVNWEGEMNRYDADSPRVYQQRAFLFDDAVVNAWAKGGEEADGTIRFAVDGRPASDPLYANGSRLRPFNARDERNSSFVIGRLSLGDRHLIEVTTPGATLVAVDAKEARNRTWHPVRSALWQGRLAARAPMPFASEWGAPYGNEKVTLAAGERITLDWVGTDLSIAWVQQQGGGTLVATVDGHEPSNSLRRPTGEATRLADGAELWMEDRAGIRGLPYGIHRLEVTAEAGPVSLLGAFVYDTRANRANERSLAGTAATGDRVRFVPPYRATPLITTSGGLKVKRVTPEEVEFEGAGIYQITGE